MNKKVLIALGFATIMIFSGVGIMGFEALSQWSPHIAGNGLLPDSTAPTGGTADVYYGISVSFTTGSASSGSNTASAANEETTYSYTSFPPPSYPAYPAYPGAPAGDSFSLDIGSTEVTSGSVGSVSYSHSQSYDHTTADIDGRTVYYTHAYSYSYTKKSWGGTYSIGYTFSAYGSSGGTDNSWTLNLGGASATTGTVDVFSGTPTATVSASQSGYDVGQAATLSVSVANSNGADTYQWYANGAAVSGATGSTYTTPSFTSTSTQSYYVQVSGNNYVVNSNTYSITPDSALSASILSNLNPSDVGQGVVFTASASGGSGSYSNYNFYLNGNSVQSTSSNQWTEDFTSSGSNSVYVVVTDTNGGTGQSSTLTQIVYPDPQAYLLNGMTPGVFYVYSYTSGPTEGAVPYSDISSYPLSMPDSNPNSVATWTGTFNDGGFGYDYGNPGYNGQTFLGRPIVAYPSSLGILNTEPGGGANDEGYMAVTVLYFTAGTYTFNGEYDDNGAMFISNNGVDWTSIIGSNAWISEGATAYSGTETLSTGWYFFAVVNGNMGGGPSMSALNITGGSISTSGTPPITKSTDAGVTQFFLTAVMGGTGTGYTYSVTGTGTTYTTPAISTTLSAGSYTVSLSATDGSGYTATASAPESVNSDPTVSASSNVSSADVGYPIEFSSSPSGGTSPYTYSWTIGGTQESTSQDFSYSFSNAGSYTVEVTVTDSIGETYSASVTVTINNNPSVSVSSSQNPTDVGNSVTFTASESGGTGTISYEWYVNGASDGSGSTLDYSFSSPGSYTVEVIVTDSDGHTASSSITETVYSDPSVTISSSQNPTDVGNSVTFTASPSGGSGSYSYQWYENSNAISGATSSTYTISLSSSGTEDFYVIIHDGVGNSAQSSTLVETINPDPTVSITSSQNPTDVGNSVTFTASGSGGTGSYSYQWYLNGTAVSGATGSTFTTTFSYSGSPTIYAVLLDSLGDEAKSSTITETVNPDPYVYISSSQNPTDVGNSVTFTASASKGTGSFSYQWYLNGATQSSTSDEFSTSFSSPGPYYVNVTAIDSIGNKVSYTYKETVNPDPSVSISYSPNPTDVGVPVSFTSSVKGGTSPYNYTWEINSVIISYNPSFTYTFDSSGAFIVVLDIVDSNGNRASANVTETVNADPSVTISSEYGSIDQGINDTFTANVHGGTYPFNYTWYSGSVIVNYSQNFHMSFSSTGTHNIRVEVQDALGMTSNYTFSVSVITKPSVSINGPDKTDIDTSAIFTGNATYGTEPYNFYWYVNGINVTSSSSGLYLEYSFTSPGTYNVSIKAVDSEGASASSYLPVIVHAKPSATITAAKSEGDLGFTDIFHSSVSGGSDPLIYQWFVGSTQVGSQPNLTYTFSSQGTITVVLRVTDFSGNTAQVETNITVNPLPSVSISARYLSLDSGVTDTFTATGEFGTPTYNYTWEVNGKITGYGSLMQYAFNNAGSYLVKTILRDTGGNTASSFITIYVNSGPIPVIFANRTLIDTGMAISFLSGITGGTGPYNYSWTINGATSGYGSSLSTTFSSPGTYEIGLTVKDSFNITGSVFENITVNPVLSVSITGENSSIDAGQKDTFISNISGGTSPYIYTWRIDGDVVSSSSNLTYSFSNEGSYIITLKVTDSLGSSASYSVSIDVNSELSATLSTEYPTVDENITDNISLAASNGTGHYTYSIFIDGGIVSTSYSYSQYFSSPGTYHVTAYVNDSSGESIFLSTNIVVRENPSVTIVTPSNRTDMNVPIQFRGVLSGGTGPYSYSWLIGGNTYSNETLTHAFISSGKYDVQLTVTDSFGREATGNVNETVYPDPHAYLVKPNYIVAAEEEPLSLNVTGGIAPYSIQWYFPGGEQFSGNNITFAFSSSGPNTFEARIADSSGYTDIQNFTVNVHLYVAIAANQTSGLGPLTVQFSSSVLGGSGYSYNWTFSPGHYSLLQNPIYQFPVGNYTVHFTVTSSNGATGQDNLSVQSLPAPVSFDYSTKMNITQAFKFKAIPNWDAAGPYNMSWSFPNGQTITGMNISYKFPVYTELNTVIATFSYGQGKTWSRDLTVRMIPAVPVLSFSPPSIIPVDTMLALNASATAPDSSTFTYSWDINGTAYAGQNQLYYFDQPGNYSVSVTVTDGLGASASLTHDIQVLPQGTNSSITISYTKNTVGPMSYFTVKVQSIGGIEAMEAFLGTTELTAPEINSTYTSSGELAYFNLTMDQRDYTSGTYGIQIVVFNNNSASNHLTIPFSVSSTYSSSSFNLGDLISFFGGMSNFLITMLTLGGLIIAWASLRRTDNPNVTIVEGSGKKAKRIQLKGRNVK